MCAILPEAERVRARTTSRGCIDRCTSKQSGGSGLWWGGLPGPLVPTVFPTLFIKVNDLSSIPNGFLMIFTGVELIFVI